MTQRDIILRLLTFPKSVAELFTDTGFRRPNIRRVLHHETANGTLERLGKGIYVIRRSDGHLTAHIACEDAEEAAKRLVKTTIRFDCVIMDIPYYSKQLVGRNRLRKSTWYDFISPEKFERVMIQVKRLLKPDCDVWLFLSGAPSAAKDMDKYKQVMRETGFYLKRVGTYTKLTAGGVPVLNIRGEVSADELLYCFTATHGVFVGDTFNVRAVRPPRKEGRSKKPISLIKRLIGSRRYVLDLFAGSFSTYFAATACSYCFLSDRKEERVEQFLSSLS